MALAADTSIPVLLQSDRKPRGLPCAKAEILAIPSNNTAAEITEIIFLIIPLSFPHNFCTSYAKRTAVIIDYQSSLLSFSASSSLSFAKIAFTFEIRSGTPLIIPSSEPPLFAPSSSIFTSPSR